MLRLVAFIFQVDDGVPVYLKRGGSDRVIFGFMVIYLGILLSWSAGTVKKIIYPPKNA